MSLVAPNMPAYMLLIDSSSHMASASMQCPLKTNRDASILKSDAADFMVYACIVVNQEGRDKQSIINMDQTP